MLYRYVFPSLPSHISPSFPFFPILSQPIPFIPLHSRPLPKRIFFLFLFPGMFVPFVNYNSFPFSVLPFLFHLCLFIPHPSCFPALPNIAVISILFPLTFNFSFCSLFTCFFHFFNQVSSITQSLLYFPVLSQLTFIFKTNPAFSLLLTKLRFK